MTEREHRQASGTSARWKPRQRAKPVGGAAYLVGRSVARRGHMHDTEEHGEAYYAEVRRAVGRGAPSLLLGTSTKSLERSLAKLKAADQGELPSAPRVASEAAAPPDDEVEITSVRVRPRLWLLGLSIIFLGVLGIAGALPHEPWARALLVIVLSLAVTALPIAVSRLRPTHQHYVSTSLFRLYVHQSDIDAASHKRTEDKANAEHQPS